MKLWKSYWEMTRWVGLKAYVAVAGVALTGVLEGSALLALVSVLDQEAGPAAQAGGVIGRLANWLHLATLPTLQFAFIVFTTLGLLSALARLVSDGFLLKIRIDIEEIARQKMSRALLETEWPHFITLRLGDISKSLIQEGGLMGQGTQVMLMAVGTMFAVAAYLATAIVISPKMTAYVVAFGAIGGVCYRWGTRAAQAHVDRLSAVMTDIGDRINNVFGSLKYFRATGRAPAAERDARAIYRDFARTYFNGTIINPIMRFAFDGASVVAITVFLYLSLIGRRESPTTTVVFLAVFYRLAPRLLSVNDFLYQAYTYLSWYDTWKARLAFATAHRTHAHGALVPTFCHSLQFQDVTFRYPESDGPVLTGITFTLEPRECLGVVGPSGSGKSTLLDLVTGLLSTQAGSILLDGTPLPEIDTEAWRRQVGLVMQESPLFHTTVLGNIAWGHDDVDEARAIRCAKQANAWEFIEQLPDGLMTIVGEKGARLSGGQKQRVALARALYQEPKLLILDEATSALDSEAEALVQTALESIKGVCAIIVVAHRLTTVRMADGIIVLDRGSIIERGSWEFLMSNPDTRLSRMAASQGMVEVA